MKQEEEFIEMTDAKSTPSYTSGLHILVSQDRSEKGALIWFNGLFGPFNNTVANFKKRPAITRVTCQTYQAEILNLVLNL